MHTHTAEEISHPTGKNQTIQLKDIQKKLPLRVLSQDDWQHWITKGFVVVKNAVSRAACQRLENVLWEFDEKDPNDPSTWYAPQRRPHVRAELNNVGMTGLIAPTLIHPRKSKEIRKDLFIGMWIPPRDLCPSGCRVFYPSRNRISKPAGFRRFPIFLSSSKIG